MSNTITPTVFDRTLKRIWVGNVRFPRSIGVTCMVRRPNARRIGLEEKQSAKMYPASSGEWSPGA